MRGIHFLTFLLLICSGRAFGQSGSELKPGADTAAINQLLKTANKTLNPDSAIMAYDKALQMSIEANYAQYRGSFGTRSVAGSGLGISLLWMNTVLFASAGWVAKSMREFGQRGRD